MKIYSIHDSKANYYLNPIMFRSNGEALRSFEQVVKDEKSQFNKSPADFTLVELGNFNPDDAATEMLPKPNILINASDFLQ